MNLEETIEFYELAIKEANEPHEEYEQVLKLLKELRRYREFLGDWRLP